MSNKLAGIALAVIGGDDRELVFIPELVKLGALVKVVGFPPRPELNGAFIINNLAQALKDVDAVILPMPGTDAKGIVRAVYSQEQLILTEELLSKLPEGTPIFVGVAKPILKEMVSKLKLCLVEVAELDEIAILNSIPTAEGAIQIAMEELPITIHGSTALVLGFGRCGTTLARTLKSLGAKTLVAARKPMDLARCYESGYQPVKYSELPVYLSEAQIIFNTVPYLILNSSMIAKLNKDCLIIDIAAAPGGTDFSAAEKAGIKAILAPGLPGKVAPKTAGKILADVYPELILQYKNEQKR
ncbi:dipicolinate synthase subunit DpsA [Bacillota bacterium LX-D]|nr:dipicolinate synthase subunit DpsA [Bacillota bacterium LX-D]